MGILRRISKSIRLFFKSRRLAHWRRTPRVFIPTPTRWSIVIPFKLVSLILLILLGLASVYLFLRSDIFLVREVDLRKSGEEIGQAPTEDEIRERLGYLFAQSIFRVDGEKIARELTDYDLSIEEVAINKELPDKLHIFYKLRQPAAILEQKLTETLPEGKQLLKSEYYLIDEEGLIFEKITQKLDLPVIKVADSTAGGTGATLGVSTRLNENLVAAALEILQNTKKISDFKIQNITIFPDAQKVWVETSLGVEVEFSSEESIDQQISSLQTILTKARMDGKRVARIDLRFTKPVVVYE